MSRNALLIGYLNYATVRCGAGVELINVGKYVRRILIGVSMRSYPCTCGNSIRIRSACNNNTIKSDEAVLVYSIFLIGVTVNVLCVSIAVYSGYKEITH